MSLNNYFAKPSPLENSQSVSEFYKAKASLSPTDSVNEMVNRALRKDAIHRYKILKLSGYKSAVKSVLVLTPIIYLTYVCWKGGFLRGDELVPFEYEGTNETGNVAESKWV